MSDRCLESVLKVSRRCLQGVYKGSVRCLLGVCKVPVRSLERVWKVVNLCSTSPTQVGTIFYLELEFDSGADPAWVKFKTSRMLSSGIFWWGCSSCCCDRGKTKSTPSLDFRLWTGVWQYCANFAQFLVKLLCKYCAYIVQMLYEYCICFLQIL